MAATDQTMTGEQGPEWAAGRELLQSIALMGLVLAPVGSLVGLGLLAVRVFAG